MTGVFDHTHYRYREQNKFSHFISPFHENNKERLRMAKYQEVEARELKEGLRGGKEERK